MPNAQVLYAESVAATTVINTTYVDLASIPAASFTANHTYLILANQVTALNSSSIQRQSRLVHGTTPTAFTDGELSWEGYNDTNGPQKHEVSWMYLYTQPGTTELVKIQFNQETTGGTSTNQLSQIIAIDLGDFTSGTHYNWAEDLADYTMTATPTAKATTASFTPNGTDVWLYIGHTTHDVVGLTTPIGFELYDSVAGALTQMQNEGEDATLDIRGNNLFWVGVPTNAARTVAVRPFDSGSSIMLASRVMAMNLTAMFAQVAYAYDNSTAVDPATSPSYTNVATVAPTPSATGNWVVLAWSVVNVNEATTNVGARLQVNAGGGGLVSTPAFNALAPQVDNWDVTDESAFGVFNVLSLSSGAARDINWDWTRVAGTTGRVEDNGVVAFSVAEATSGSTVSGTFTADAYLLKTTSGSFTADAFLFKAGIAGTFTADAYFKKLDVAGSFTTDAFIAKVNASSFTADAYIRKTAASSFTSDAIVKATVASSFTADAFLLKSGIAGSFTADAAISKQTSGTFTADSFLKRAIASSFTADANIRVTVASSFTADAFVKKLGIASSFTADGYVKATLAGSFTADAEIVVNANTIAGSFTADAYIRATASTTFTADSFIKKTTSGTFTADAYLRIVSSGSFTADAFIKAAGSGSFTADAFVRATASGTFTADAAITKVGRITWTTPGDLVSITNDPTFSFIIPTSTGNIFFHIELDTVNTFDGVNFRYYKSVASQTGWEYYNGAAWVAVPATGVPNTYSGNEARFSPPTLATATWFRRIRGGV